VLNIFKKGNITAALRGQQIGTVISGTAGMENGV